jgi:hypothetical protein
MTFGSPSPRRPWAGPARPGALLAAVALALFTGAAGGQAAPAAAPITFGIYPGGDTGLVNASGVPSAVSQTSRLAPLEQLRAPGRPFVLHLYAIYAGPAAASASAQLGATITRYARAGFSIELVLAYRPIDRTPATDVPGFVAWVQQAVHDHGGGVGSFQITNEANLPGMPATSDGDFPGVEDALIEGVIAAKAQSLADGATIQVGFSWAYDLQASEPAFWAYLGVHGGAAFVAALDWIGIDAYPGTFGPSLPHARRWSDAVRYGLGSALHELRDELAPLAGIPASVPIHISEVGYPIGRRRTSAAQVTALRAIVSEAESRQVHDNISELLWFDLRDADTSGASLGGHFGLMTDGYAARPAFNFYRGLIRSARAPASAT